jgi:outer membrane lipoprotein-sorting protein
MKDEKAIWAEVRNRNGTIADFKCESAKLTLESGFRVFPVNAHIYFRYPDWLTFRIFGPMNLKFVEASLQANQFQIYSPFTKEYITGSLDSVDLGTRFKIPLPDLDLRNAWSRLFNPTPFDAPVTETKIAGSYYILTYNFANRTHEIWIDGKNRSIYMENVKDSEGKLLANVTYTRYKKRSQVRFPRTIEFNDYRGVKLTLEMNKFDINCHLSDADLMISVPADAQKIELKGS